MVFIWDKYRRKTVQDCNCPNYSSPILESCSPMQLWSFWVSFLSWAPGPPSCKERPDGWTAPLRACRSKVFWARIIYILLRGVWGCEEAVTHTDFLGSMLVTLARYINLWAQQKQCLTVVKSMNSGARFPGFASHLLHFLACDLGEIIQFHWVSVSPSVKWSVIMSMSTW